MKKSNSTAIRIITWNCNMAFRKKYARILKMKPDVLVIQECENIDRLHPFLEKISYNNILWYGNNPNKGIAIISFNECLIEPMDEFDNSFEYILPLTLRCANTLSHLFCIWAMPHKTERSKNYVGQIWGAMKYYSNLLKKPSILIGDFNSNAFWDESIKTGNHSELVNFLAQENIISIYHRQEQVAPGNEKDPTFFLVKKKEKPYHLDYCFVSQQMIGPQTKLEVGKYEHWIKLSDHMPIIIDQLILGV